MFERFTERARIVVVSAQDEARAFKHDQIGTEHVLLGLMRVEEGLGARVLASLGVTIEAVRAQVMAIDGEGAEAVSGQIPFTPRAKRVLELALREALSLGHNYIGAEHILLGLVGEKDGIAYRILTGFGLTAEIVRNEVVQTLSGPGPRPVKMPSEEERLGYLLVGLLDATRRVKEAAISQDQNERVAACERVEDHLEFVAAEIEAMLANESNPDSGDEST